MEHAVFEKITAKKCYTPGMPGEGRRTLTEDMWDDYNAADAETRKIMVQRWGAPVRR